MADKNSKSNENLNEVVAKFEGQIMELKNKISDLEAKNVALMELNKILEAEKLSHQSLPDRMPSKKEFNNKRRAQISTKLSVPNWLVEVLAWIGRIEMANSSLSTASATFHQLCRPKLHGNVKPHGLGSELYLSKGRFELGPTRTFVDSSRDGFIPIATIPPPDYIIGASWIHFSIFKLDDQMLNFIKNIAHLLQNCIVQVSDSLCWCKKNNRRKAFDSVKNIVLNILLDKIFGFAFTSSKLTMNDFDGLFPGIFDSAQFISFTSSNFNTDLLVNWLNKPRNDGKQKLVKMLYSNREFDFALIQRIINEFLQSILPSTFTIRFETVNFNFNNQFTIENAHSNEFLNFYSKMDADRRFTQFYYLARYRKGEEEWKEEGEKKIHHSQPMYATTVDF